jgi:hypothetical protein
MAPERFETLVFVMFAMVLILVVAAAVVVYAAFPHRGMDVPRYPWVGEAMRKGVRALPTLDNQREHQRDAARERQHAP